MSNTANGQTKLIALLKTSNKLFKSLQQVSELNSNLDLISPENMKEAEKLIKGLGSRDLLKLVNEMEKRLYESQD